MESSTHYVIVEHYEHEPENTRIWEGANGRTLSIRQALTAIMDEYGAIWGYDLTDWRAGLHKEVSLFPHFVRGSDDSRRYAVNVAGPRWLILVPQD